MSQQGSQSFLHARRRIRGEDHGPAGRRKVLGVDPFGGTKRRFGVSLMPLAQFSEMSFIEGLALRESRLRRRCR
jgi:hypothetical protein